MPLVPPHGLCSYLSRRRRRTLGRRLHPPGRRVRAGCARAGITLLLSAAVFVLAQPAGASAASARTLGTTTVGTLSQSAAADTLAVSGSYQLQPGGMFGKLTGYLAGGGSQTAVRAVIYADDGSGDPGAVRRGLLGGDGRGRAAGRLGRFPASCAGVSAGR